MTTTYRTNYGETFVATTSADLVRQLRQSSHTPTRDVDEFMRDAAKRAATFHGAEVSTASIDEFVADLVKAGLVKIVGGGSR